ncbi:MAG: peptidoglycan editing factor PgeF [Clostridia bacterium]|nr:peptidoglycan editing factor PgeF [Clostridia bacterium]
MGGVSEKPYDTLNLAFHTGDDYRAVQVNRERFTQALGIPAQDLVAANQVHGANICRIEITDKGKGALDQQTVIEATDSLMTNTKGVPLIAFFADCVPVMFLDPQKKAIAITHAGWKGTVLKIGAKTVRKMAFEYGSNPKDLLVIIGPAIGPCHYEVDGPVIEVFQNNFVEWKRLLEIKEDNKAQLNLGEANRIQLLEEGVLAENITLANICTACHQDLFYSHRYSDGKTGRLAGAIMLV